MDMKTGPENDSRHNDVSSYEEAEDGTPGTIRKSVREDGNVDQRKSTKTTTLTGSEEGREGDYSQEDMDGACSLANPLVSGVGGVPKTGGKKSGHAAGTGDHSTVTKSGHKAVVAPTAGQEEGDYNTITHHRQKCPPAGEARDATGNIYSLPESCSVRAKPGARNKSSAQPKPAGKHGSVTKPSHKAAVVPQLGQEEGDYNIIIYNRKKAVSPSKGRETIDNPYNVPMSASETGDATPDNHHTDTIQRVDNLEDGGKAASKSEGRETTEGEHSNDAGVYFLLEPDQTAGNVATHSGQGEANTDEYNTLSFTCARGTTAMPLPRGGKHSAYDRVCTDTDGDYNTAQIGKKNVVIDSNYESINY